MSHLYKMFEKELTHGNHVSYHFFYNYFDTISPKNSKLYQYEKQLKETVTNYFDLVGFQNTITSPNTTLRDDASFNVAMYTRFIDDETKKFFHINSKFPITYFAKKVNDSIKPSPYKCGYVYETLKYLKHPLEDKIIEFMDFFKEETSHPIFASHFDENGESIEDEMNLEIMPHYTRENFLSLKKKLIENFDVKKEVLDLYDKKLLNYKETDFHYHLKIKLKSNKTIIKFYRTYPINPYLIKFNFKYF